MYPKSQNLLILNKKQHMIIERTNNEILIRLSTLTNTSDLQDMLDYLKYKEAVSKSKAKQEDIDKLSKEVNKDIWNKIREKRDFTKNEDCY